MAARNMSLCVRLLQQLPISRLDIYRKAFSSRNRHVLGRNNEIAPPVSTRTLTELVMEGEYQGNMEASRCQVRAGRWGAEVSQSLYVLPTEPVLRLGDPSVVSSAALHHSPFPQASLSIATTSVAIRTACRSLLSRSLFHFPPSSSFIILSPPPPPPPPPPTTLNSVIYTATL